MFQKFGRYILLEKIATGGMAEIWLAKQFGVKGFEKLVVIKKILPHFNTNEKFTKMFINEAKIASKLNHPNIVQIYDLGSEHNNFYIVMEYVPGYDLLTIVKTSIKAKKRLPLAYSVKIISQAANALYYANNFRDINTQKLNIVHRDISPQNILVSYDGITKVVDFGIAKAASNDNMTKTGVLKGKYPYMSPEQIIGKKLDGRSDIFSLAIVLYEITVGKRLFKATSELMTLKKITEEKIISPIEIYPKYPKRLSDIIMKALARNRANRYSSAREFAHDLDSFLIETQKNISTSEVSKWLKELFKDDIINRILSNKKLFNDADVFLEREELNRSSNKGQPEHNNSLKNDNINQFEFDKSLTTNDLQLSFEQFNKEYTDSKIEIKKNDALDLKDDSLKAIKDDEQKYSELKEEKKYFKKGILFLFLILFVYLFIFTGSFYYAIYYNRKFLGKSISDAANLDFSGKALETKVKIFCENKNVSCNKNSIRVLELKDNLKLKIKYKIKKKLFGVIPIELDYDENMERELVR